MKKTKQWQGIFWIVILICGMGYTHAAGKLNLTLGAGIRTVSADEFSNTFGSSKLVFGGDLAYKLSKSLEIFLHSDFLSATGNTTYTNEEAKFTLLPIELGARLLFGKSKLSAYIGAGAGMYQYKDSMTIESTTSEVTGSQFGFFAEAGLRYPLSKSIFADLKAKYNILTIKPKDDSQSVNGGTVYLEEINMSGFGLIAGVGISF